MLTRYQLRITGGACLFLPRILLLKGLQVKHMLIATGKQAGITVFTNLLLKLTSGVLIGCKMARLCLVCDESILALPG